MAFDRRSTNGGVGLAIALFSLGVVGCRQTSSEYVEAELRVQSRKVSDLQNALAQRDAEIQTLKSTVTTYQASHVKPADAPEAVYRDTALSRISLTMTTGGTDADLDGKDDGVVIGVAPHDYDGDVFKSPGSCRVQLFETPPNGVLRQIGEWSLTAERLRGLWRSTLIGQGYHLTLGWQTPPSERRLRAIVTFITVDGRKFQAEKDFDVSLQAKGPPKLPGVRIDAESLENPPIETKMILPGDLPKPQGLGSLTPLGSNLTLGPVPAKPASPPNKPEPKIPTAAAVVGNRPSVSGPEHSRPPIVDRDRMDTTPANAASPGDRADADDIIVLPAAAIERVELKKTVEPATIAKPVESKAKPASLDLDLPPPPAALKGSSLSRISLPEASVDAAELLKPAAVRTKK